MQRAGFVFLVALAISPAAALAGPPTVVDANNKRLGALTSSPGGEPCPSNVLLKVGKTLVALGVDRTRIVRCSVPAFLHDSTDCSGPRYLAVATSDLARRAYIDGTTASYPADPIQTRTIRSQEVAGYTPAGCTARGGTPVGSGLCCLPDNISVETGSVATFDLSVFTPPFRVK